MSTNDDYTTEQSKTEATAEVETHLMARDPSELMAREAARTADDASETPDDPTEQDLMAR